MASSAKHPIFIFFLVITITLSSSLLHIAHARDSQLFSKTPNVVVPNNNVEPKEEPEKNNNQEQTDDGPNFLPQNEESYGLYGHETGQLPPSTAKTTAGRESKPTLHHKYLPKNYNPVAYVTVPENTNEEEETTTFDASNTDDVISAYNNGRKENYYSAAGAGAGEQKEEDFSEYSRRSYNNPTTTATTEDKNYYYRLGSDFNSPRETTTAPFEDNGGEGFQRRQQGMSDTRFLENGKYHYDVSLGKFSSNHPYEALKAGSYYEPEGAEYQAGIP